MRWAAVASWIFLACVLAGGALQSLVTDIARDNLSNHAFERGHQWTPADFGLPFVDVEVPSDGLTLAGWWMPASAGAEAQRANTTVILVHGLGSNMSKPMRMWAPALHDAGYSLLALDLRNHGASPNGPRGYVTYGADEAKDALAAVSFVRAGAEGLGVDGGRIVLYGGSMGGATVLNAAARAPHGVIGVIADSPFASLRFEAGIDGAAQGYPGWIISWVLDRMDALAPSPPTSSHPRAALASIPVPVLLAQCSDDENISPPNHEALMAAAPPGTTIWLESCPTGLSSEHHLDGWMKPSYNATVRAFLERL